MLLKNVIPERTIIYLITKGLNPMYSLQRYTHTHTHTKVIALNFSIMNLTLTIKFTIKRVMLFLCPDITPAGAVIILNLR